MNLHNPIKKLVCPNCKSKKINYNEFSPIEKPYVIRTEYNCISCKNYWYEDN